MQKAIIFDWSGTLLDSFEAFCEVCDLMFKELGSKPILPDEIRRTFTTPYMKFWNYYFPTLSKEKQDKLFEKFIHQVTKASVYPNTKEILETLKGQGYWLFVVSSDPQSTLFSQIEQSNLSSLFVEVYGQVHDKTEVLKKIAQKYNLSMDEKYYVGDTDGDVLMGKNAGYKTIGITGGFQDAKQLEVSQPDYLIHSLNELLRIIA